MGMATTYQPKAAEPFDPKTVKPGMAFKDAFVYQEDLRRRGHSMMYKFIRYVTTYAGDHIFEYWHYPITGGKAQGFAIFGTDFLVRDPENDWLECNDG